MSSRLKMHDTVGSPNDKQRNNSRSPRQVRHEIALFRADPIDYGELTQLLNELLEGERAGAQGLRQMSRVASDPALKALLLTIWSDEAKFCAMLKRILERIGAKPSRIVGRFRQQLRKRASLGEKLELLDRGQAAVVRRLDAVLPRIDDPKIHADLARMRDVHILNIHRCAEFTSTTVT